MNNEILNIGLTYQVMIVLTGYFIKPAHMIITGLLIRKLKNVSSRDIKIIRWGLIIFFMGEIACATNYIVADDNSLILEIVHDVFMTGLSGVVLLGIITFFDDRIFHFSNSSSRCSFQKLCGKCWKFNDVECKIKNLFYFIVICAIFISMIPLSIELKPVNEIFGVFGSNLNCSVSGELLFFKYCIFPFVASLMFLITICFLLKKGSIEKAKTAFFTGCGFMIYSLMSFFFIEAFRPVLFMANFWEEATELAAIVCVGYFLHIFRDSYS